MEEQGADRTTVTIRELDTEVWERIRAEARRQRWHIAAVVEAAWRAYERAYEDEPETASAAAS